MGTYETLITWDCFSETFFDRFFQIELREEKAQKATKLRQGNIMVQEYEIKFNKL